MKISSKTFIALAAGFLVATGMAVAAPGPAGASPWQSKLDAILPLLGHRNWIMIVDSAYPLQSSPGVETIETNANQLDVVRTVLNDLDRSIHVRPIVHMDAELPFVTERNAPGVTAYRKALKAILGNRPVQSSLHDEIIRNIGETGKTFQIVILKTTMTIPYTSVFLQLDCKYWSAAQEQQLRQAMSKAVHK